MIQKDNKKIIRSWAFYDWANSVYALIITASMFPAYYNSVTTGGNGFDKVIFLGITIKNTVLYTYAFSFSVLLTALLSPVLSGVADYTGLKKSFMRFFVIVGSLACISLAFFDQDYLAVGIFGFIIANMGFNGSLVFYNAYLPEIATPKLMDRASARGYAYGYTGSVILLLLNLMLIFYMDSHSPGSDLAYRISFISVGLWWLGFSQITFSNLPSMAKKKFSGKSLSKGYRELLTAFNELRKSTGKKGFLFSFFFYSMGVQTVLYMASLFGAKVLHIDSISLIISILIIQLVAIGGAYLAARLSEAKGNVISISISLIIWIIICIVAFVVRGKTGFFGLAFLVGLVMGGIQSISRSTFAKMIPKDSKDTASFFSFYEFTEKMAIVLGTFAYGLVEALTGNMRNSVLALSGFFIAGLLILVAFRKSVISDL